MQFQTVNNSVTAVEFKLLFTPGERVQARETAKTDPLVTDMFELLDDPRTSHIDLTMPQVDSMLSYLVTLNILTEERKAQILGAQVPDASQINPVNPTPSGQPVP